MMRGMIAALGTICMLTGFSPTAFSLTAFSPGSRSKVSSPTAMPE